MWTAITGQTEHVDSLIRSLHIQQYPITTYVRAQFVIVAVWLGPSLPNYALFILLYAAGQLEVSAL